MPILAFPKLPVPLSLVFTLLRVMLSLPIPHAILTPGLLLGPAALDHAIGAQCHAGHRDAASRCPPSHALVPIPAIQACTWRGGAVSTRNPDHAYPTSSLPLPCSSTWPPGGIGRAAGLTPFGPAETICGQRG